jgi:hypothetical protein
LHSPRFFALHSKSSLDSSITRATQRARAPPLAHGSYTLSRIASGASGSKRKAGGPAGADAVNVSNGPFFASSSDNPSAFATEGCDKAMAIMETEDMMHGAVTRAAGAARVSCQQFGYHYRQWQNFHRYPSSVRGPPPSLGLKARRRCLRGSRRCVGT